MKVISRLDDESPDPGESVHRERGTWLDALAALASIGAGLYLLSSQAVASDSYIELLAHGIGVYFIAKGVYMARTAHLQTRMAGYLAELVRRGD